MLCLQKIERPRLKYPCTIVLPKSSSYNYSNSTYEIQKDTVLFLCNIFCIRFQRGTYALTLKELLLFKSSVL